MGIRFPILFLFVMSRTLGHSAELSALSQAIDPDWIAQALATTGKASIRKRKLPAEQVVWLVIALALYRHQS
ncbi:transposase domain-containing protein, partial [Rhizobium favelukesii]